MNILKNRNFLLLFIGRILTNIGDSLYAVAAMWLVYDLGGSTLYTGLAGFLSILPRIIQIFSGPLIDRVPLRGLLVYTQLIQAGLLLIVPAAHYMGFLTVGLVLTITPIMSTLNMWVYPAQMSALPKILDKKQLTQGNSLFTLAYQGIDVACNAISGGLIILLGAVSLYLWNAVGFFIGAVLFAQLRIHSASSSSNNDLTTSRETQVKDSTATSTSTDSFKSYMEDMRFGLRFLLGSPLARVLLGMIMINAVGGATFTVMPAFADSLGGAGIYGILLMAQACGSLLGALAAPYLKLEKFRLGVIYGVAFFVMGAAWALSVFTPWTWLVVLTYGLAWFPGGITNVIINTVIQKTIPQQHMATVFAASNGLSGIASPLGSLIGGSLGLLLASSSIIAGSGLIVLLIGVLWLLDPVTRKLPPPDRMDESLFAPLQSAAQERREQANPAAPPA
ncbi:MULTISPECIES: MFS transporter [Paenibacillus]|uniref:MFS transporter n=1 Tax=Paenibacillus campinasensis TaxID=66347 RepID=A0A268EX80_9BACL|nr:MULTISPECIES: MFS transporter [Paenibacillus]PAD77729.1 MFS transporter [Paenibacillus campinasensis]PAK48051.1 MFS transporter [Paenibacillus sp. 7541]